MRRTEDRIQKLCGEILAARNDDRDISSLALELRKILHQHMENVRTHLAQYPILGERRVHGTSGRTHEEGTHKVS